MRGGEGCGGRGSAGPGGEEARPPGAMLRAKEVALMLQCDGVGGAGDAVVDDAEPAAGERVEEDEVAAVVDDFDARAALPPSQRGGVERSAVSGDAVLDACAALDLKELQSFGCSGVNVEHGLVGCVVVDGGPEIFFGKAFRSTD